MKKLILVAFALMAGTLAVSAQSIHPRVEVAGNFSKAAGDNVKDLKIRPGFRVGAAAEFGLPAGLYLAPGLTFRQEGEKAELAGSTASIGRNYLTIPVNIGIRAGLGDQLAVSVEAGPTFSYGVSTSGQDNLFKNGSYKRFDAGIDASAALEYNKVYVRVGMDWGLTNFNKRNVLDALSQASNPIDSRKNASFFVGLGYRF